MTRTKTDRASADPFGPWIDGWEKLEAEGNAGRPIFPALTGRLLREHGRSYEPVLWRAWRGRGFRMGPHRECYSNALKLALQYDLLYVEGLAHSVLFPMEHAWCVERGSNLAIDPTWRTAEGIDGWHYLGIAMEPDAALDLMMERQTYGAFDKLEIADRRLVLPDGLVAA